MSMLVHYMIFSTIEFMAGMAFMLSMFLFPIRPNWMRLALTALVLTQISYFIREVLGLIALAPIIQALLMVLFLCLLFRVQWFYSFIIVVTGYVAVVLIELINLFVLQLFYPDFIQQSLENKWMGDIVQTLNSIFSLVLCCTLRTYRLGFLLVADREKVPVNVYNRMLFAGAILSYITLIFVSFDYFSNVYFNLSLYVFWITILLSVIYGAVKNEVTPTRRYPVPKKRHE